MSEMLRTPRTQIKTFEEFGTPVVLVDQLALMGTVSQRGRELDPATPSNNLDRHR